MLGIVVHRVEELIQEGGGGHPWNPFLIVGIRSVTDGIGGPLLIHIPIVVPIQEDGLIHHCHHLVEYPIPQSGSHGSHHGMGYQHVIPSIVTIINDDQRESPPGNVVNDSIELFIFVLGQIQSDFFVPVFNILGYLFFDLSPRIWGTPSPLVVASMQGMPRIRIGFTSHVFVTKGSNGNDSNR